jgi:hypothetical protein
MHSQEQEHKLKEKIKGLEEMLEKAMQINRSLKII